MLCVTCQSSPAKWADASNPSQIFCDSRMCQIGLKTDFSSKGEKIDQDDLIGLISSDGIKFEVLKDKIMQSETLKNLIEDAGVDNYIELPNMDSQVLGIIADYLNGVYIMYDDIDRDLTDRLIQASNFLDLAGLKANLMSRTKRPKMEEEKTVTWLNLHHFLTKDTRGLIYKYLTKDDMKLVEVAHNSTKKVDFSYNFMNYCAIHGYLDLIKWAIEVHGARNWDRHTLRHAAKNGYLDVLKYLIIRVNRGEGVSKDNFQRIISAKHHLVCAGAAQGGHLFILQFLRENGFPWSESTLYKAAEYGHLDVLKWAYENGCDQLNTVLFVYGASGGNIPVLEYLLSINTPWDENVCTSTAWDGQLQALQWLRVHGAPWNESICYNAASRGHLHILQWAVANGCPWDREKCIKYATGRNHTHILEWINKN